MYRNYLGYRRFIYFLQPCEWYVPSISSFESDSDESSIEIAVYDPSQIQKENDLQQPKYKLESSRFEDQHEKRRLIKDSHFLPNRDIKEDAEEGVSSDESYYSFESDTEYPERKIQFGSSNSIPKEVRKGAVTLGMFERLPKTNV